MMSKDNLVMQKIQRIIKSQMKQNTKSQARKLARYILNHTQKNSPETNEHMLKIFSRLHAYGGLQAYFNDHKLKKTTYYKYKAAYQFGAALKIRSLFNEEDKIEKADRERAKKCRRNALALAEEINSLSPDYEKKHLELRTSANFPKPYTNKKIEGKRKDLKGLPADWIDQVISELPIQHKNAALIMAVTGCRPFELKNGVILELVDEDLLRIKIKGAKYKKNKQGQKERVLTVASWTVPSLFNLAYEEPYEIWINRETYRKAVRRAIDKLGFDNISPYCFRHQFAADLKAELGENWTHEDIAKALGHITDRCQQYYGHPNQNRGRGSGILNIESSGPVKKTRGTFPEQDNSSRCSQN